MRWEGCDLPHYDVLWSECRYHLQFKFILLMIAILEAPSPACPAPGPIHHAGPTHSLSGIWQTFFTRGCQIKTGEHRDDFNFNLLSSRCHAASWYRDKQWKYFSSHDLIVIIIRANKNNIMAPDPFKARQFPEFLYPLPPALSPSAELLVFLDPKTAGHLISHPRWHPSPGLLCGRIEMSDDGRGALGN